MQIVINPKDNNQLSSASLDRTIKVWQLGSSTPNFTLEGHEKGVNCIDRYTGGDKPYLVSGADDRLVTNWDYQNKTCLQTLEGHTQNVSCVSFHPELPIILTGSEDGTVRVWHFSTHRLENTLNYGMERVWCVCGQRSANSVALGYDEGSIIIKLKDDPWERLRYRTERGCPCPWLSKTWAAVRSTPRPSSTTPTAGLWWCVRNKSFGSAQEFVWGHDSSE
uniref:coatomer subunit beta'-like n=1 Tax=Oncorhynchus gorbuscha TaxID=8017 RepID=UPI001EAEF534|nr:coatomer subunit beta'-like [Oncorhynchus gorbuscha]XP_046171461.1 coatomer subunit beta'-like [Oncorhynchus gorbuscha]